MNILSHLQSFKTAFSKQQYQDAYDAFCKAMQEDATFACRALTVSDGSLGRVADELGKVDEIASMFDAAFAKNPQMHMMCPNIPSQVDHIRQVREENLAKGMPSVVLITLRKSGTISLANIFTSGLNLPSYTYSFLDRAVVDSWARDYARGGCCQAIHLQPTVRNIEGLKRAGLNRLIVNVRDPRQAMLSRLHHIKRYREMFPEYNTPRFFQQSMDEKLHECIHIYRGFVEWIEGWMKASDMLDIHFSTFEDFIKDRDAFTQAYLDFYGKHAKVFNPDAAFTEHAGTDYHKRLGEIDEWRRVFSPENQRLLNSMLSDEMREHFGWVD